MPSRELTQEERAAIRKLVTRQCANYCGTNKLCLPLDEPCYMLGKVWTGAYCKYFREAVLPLDLLLAAALLGREAPVREISRCAICRKPFPAKANHIYCGAACRKEGNRRKSRARMKKMRRGPGCYDSG